MRQYDLEREDLEERFNSGEITSREYGINCPVTSKETTKTLPESRLKMHTIMSLTNGR